MRDISVKKVANGFLVSVGEGGNYSFTEKDVYIYKTEDELLKAIPEIILNEIAKDNEKK